VFKESMGLIDCKNFNLVLSLNNTASFSLSDTCHLAFSPRVNKNQSLTANSDR